MLRLVGAAALMCMSLSPAGAQEEEAEQVLSFPDAYVSRVDRKLADLQAEVADQRLLLSERGGELLGEIGLRLDEGWAELPIGMQFADTAVSLPLPASIRRLNEYDRMLADEVYGIDERIVAALEEIGAQRDSLVAGLKTTEATRAVVDELDQMVRTDLELWRTKVDLIRRRLISDGTPDAARRMFAREYSTIAMHYQMGQYRVALARMETLAEPYGALPLPEWLESLPFYRAECYYALAEWDSAYDSYAQAWQQPGNLYAPQALLDWTELAFSGGRHREVATMWTAQPPMPPDPIDANRIRLLVAESYLRLGEPDQALTTLDRLDGSRPLMPGEEEWLDAEGLAELRALNGRLIIYGRLLRAEAHADGGGLARQASAPRTLAAPSGEALAAMADTSVDTSLFSAGTDTAHLAATLAGRLDSAAVADSLRRVVHTAYLIASGSIRPAATRRRGVAVDSVIEDLESLVPVVSAIDRNGPLMARTLVALGHAYSQANRWADAAAAYGAVPVSSIWYPEAQLARGWALMEQGYYLEAKSAVNVARRWPLSPSATLEAAALNSYILSLMGREEEAVAEMHQMARAVDLEERRSMSASIDRELHRMEASLRLAGVIALERQNEELYRAVVDEQARYDSLRAQVAQVEEAIRAYTAGQIDSAGPVLSSVRAEQERLQAVATRVVELRRAAGELPAADVTPDLTYEERREQLQSWLGGIAPAQELDMYRSWAEYAEFAYAKRIFEENQRRRDESQRLKVSRARITGLISESP